MDPGISSAAVDDEERELEPYHTINKKPEENEGDTLAGKVEGYARALEAKTVTGDLDELVNPATLSTYILHLDECSHMSK